MFLCEDESYVFLRDILITKDPKGRNDKGFGSRALVFFSFGSLRTAYLASTHMQYGFTCKPSVSYTSYVLVCMMTSYLTPTHIMFSENVGFQ